MWRNLRRPTLQSTRTCKPICLCRRAEPQALAKGMYQLVKWCGSSTSSSLKVRFKCPHQIRLLSFSCTRFTCRSAPAPRPKLPRIFRSRHRTRSDVISFVPLCHREDRQCGSSSTGRVDRQRVDCVRTCVWLWSNLSNTEQRGCLRLMCSSRWCATHPSPSRSKHPSFNITIGRSKAATASTQLQLVSSLFHPSRPVHLP